MGFELMNHREIGKEDSKVLLSGFLVVAFAFLIKLFSYTECGKNFFDSGLDRSLYHSKTVDLIYKGKTIQVPIEYIDLETGETVSLVAEQPADSSDKR